MGFCGTRHYSLILVCRLLGSVLLVNSCLERDRNRPAWESACILIRQNQPMSDRQAGSVTANAPVSGRNCRPSQKDKPHSILERCTFGCISLMLFYINFIYNDLRDDVNPSLPPAPVIRQSTKDKTQPPLHPTHELCLVKNHADIN